MQNAALTDSLKVSMQASDTAAVDLHWLPLGPGGRSVHFNGRAFEAIAAARQHRCRRGGSIPDLGEAVGGPRPLTSEPLAARRLLGLGTAMPRRVSGRDELKAGEMWNPHWMIAGRGLGSAMRLARGPRPAAARLTRSPGTRPIAVGSAIAVGVGLLRARSLRWGSTDDEMRMPLSGDELIPHADLTATRATTIRASTEQVWPWIAQLGQGRGGFYSYDRLENLVGCDIHSADRIVPEWQDITVGDRIALAPEVSLDVAFVEPQRSLVLRGGIPIANVAAPYEFTWVFVLRPAPEHTTRLLVRERYAYTRRWARVLVEPTEAVSFVMSQKMLRGIKERAEHRGASAQPPRRERSPLTRPATGPMP